MDRAGNVLASDVGSSSGYGVIFALLLFAAAFGFAIFLSTKTKEQRKSILDPILGLIGFIVFINMLSWVAKLFH